MQLTFEDTFKVSDYAGDKSNPLFVVQDLDLKYVYDTQVDAKSPEGKAIQEMVTKEFQTALKKIKADKEKQFKEIFLATEENLLKSADKKKEALLQGATKDGKADEKALASAVEKWLAEEVKGANVMIKNALTSLNGTFTKTMEETWTKSAAAVDGKFKTTLKSQKIKASAQVVGEVSVVAMKSAAPLITQAIGLGIDLIKSLKDKKKISADEVLQGVMSLATEAFQSTGTALTQTVQSVQKNAPSHAKSAAKVQTAMTALTASLKPGKGDDKGGKGGGLNKIKQLFAANGNQKKDLEKALTELESWNFKLMQDIEALAKSASEGQKKGQAQFGKGAQRLVFAVLAEPEKKKIKELEGKIAGLFKQMGDEDQKISKARTALKDYEKIVNDAREILKAEDEKAGDKLADLVGKLNAIGNSPEVTNLKAVGMGSASLAKDVFNTIKSHTTK